MELTLDEALQKGIEAHKAGQIEEADRLYTAILKAQPNHPDANHNMGVLAVSAGKVKEALPFFQAALEAKPSTAQFWLSYLGALIQLDQIVDAKAVFDQAKENGANGEAFDQLEQQLAENKVKIYETNSIGIEGANSSKPNILDDIKLDKALRLAKRKSTEGQLEEAKDIYQDILQKFPKNKQALTALTLLTGSATPVAKDPPLGQLQPIINLYAQGELKQALSHATKMLEKFPGSIVLYNIAGASNLGLTQFDAAIKSYKHVLKIKPGYAEAYYNMGMVLNAKGDSEAAIESYKEALKIKPGYAEAYYNLGNILNAKGDLQAAIDSYKKALKMKPDFAEAYNNMGNVLKYKGDFQAALNSYKQALKIKPDYAEAYFSMGMMLQELGKKGAAEASYRRAIELKPDYAEVYDNLGLVLQEIGRFAAAEASYKRAIVLKPDYAEPFSNLGIIHYINGDVVSALECMEKSKDIDPKSKVNGLLFSIVQARTARKKTGSSLSNISNPSYDLGLFTNPLILNRPVEEELIANLSKMNTRALDSTKDARYGNGRCSVGFDLVENDHPIIKIMAEDLIRIMKEAVKSDIYVFDSFFNIIGAGGGSTPHNHLDLPYYSGYLKDNVSDEDHRIDLASHKYSLVYYLSIGDQTCNEPGIFKLYDPNEDILPCEGMIVIIPASRNHSAVYDGKKDRVVLAVNFYTL